MGICDGRVVIVTGAGRGLGRAYAKEFARQGASVVVNDLGSEANGRGSSRDPAREVAASIRADGGNAIENADDVSDWQGARRLIRAAIDSFGKLDILVNNAGFVRDRMFVTTSESDWDDVVRVHQRGHFCTARHAVDHWRERAKRGERVDARIVNTSSGAGLIGSVGQSAYATAKAGIVALTLVQAAELVRYGITANVIAPAARTRLTESVFVDMMKKPDNGFDAMDPENVAPLVVWLGSVESAGVTGRVFEACGGQIRIADGWRDGASIDRGVRLQSEEVGGVVRELLERAPEPRPVYGS